MFTTKKLFLCKETTHWKRTRYWKRLKGKGEEGSREWDGQIALLTQWTWIWANSGKQWRTEEPGMLWFTGSQRIGQDLGTEQQLVNNWEMCYPIMIKRKWTGYRKIILEGTVSNRRMCYELGRMAGEKRQIHYTVRQAELLDAIPSQRQGVHGTSKGIMSQGAGHTSYFSHSEVGRGGQVVSG